MLLLVLSLQRHRGGGRRSDQRARRSSLRPPLPFWRPPVRSRFLLALVTLLALAGLSGVPAGADDFAVRDDADHTEYFFSMGDVAGTQLHADVLRPKGMAADVRTP